jgi:hypothetical protein
MSEEEGSNEIDFNQKSYGNSLIWKAKSPIWILSFESKPPQYFLRKRNKDLMPPLSPTMGDLLAQNEKNDGA